MISISNKKKYELIADKIEEMILEHSMKEGQRLASVNDLCKMFNVAPATMCNSLELLRDRGVIQSIARKGNFIKCLPVLNGGAASAATYRYIERCSPVSSIFSSPLTTLKIYLEDYDIPCRKEFWNGIFSQMQTEIPRLNIVATADKGQISDCDIVLAVREDITNLSADPVICDKLWNKTSSDDYFPAAFQNRDFAKKYAAMPFSVSQEMRLWNCTLAEKYCPGIARDIPQNIISHIINNYDYRADDFPLVASFIHFLPLTLLSEGIDIYNVETGKPDFSDNRIPGIFEFNRFMFEKFMDMASSENEYGSEFFWKSFSNGEILFLDTFSYSLMVLPENPAFEMMVQASDMSRFNCSVSVPCVLGIGKNCRDIDNSIKFIKFACGKAGQAMLAKSRSNIPAMRAVAESSDFLNHCPPNMKSVLQNLNFQNSVLNEMEIFDENKFIKLQALIQDYLYGQLELKETIDILRKNDFSE